jgi:hypothetical protein
LASEDTGVFLNSDDQHASWSYDVADLEHGALSGVMIRKQLYPAIKL